MEETTTTYPVETTEAEIVMMTIDGKLLEEETRSRIESQHKETMRLTRLLIDFIQSIYAFPKALIRKTKPIPRPVTRDSPITSSRTSASVRETTNLTSVILLTIISLFFYV